MTSTAERPAPVRESRWARAAERVAASTPRDRDRAADALRAIAILGVVLGHWLVTAFVDAGDDGLGVRSPLASMPQFTPLSWVLQTLAVFFLVGGYSAALGRRGAARTPYRHWAATRMGRLFRPALVLLGAWAVALGALIWAGLDLGTVRTLVKLVFSPLWFLAVYAALTAATPAVVALWRRAGGWGLMLPIGTVAAVDLGRFALGAPSWTGWVNVLAGWLVPYYLGVTWAHGAFQGRSGRRAAWTMLLGGAAATAALVLGAGYPASMVGVPGAAVSNLNPPTLAVVAFGLAQVGLALLVRDVLARHMRRPRLWAVVAFANVSAMTVFLWHQTAMMAVTVSARSIGRLPGLHTSPDHPAWLGERLVWLPVFGILLAGLWAVFHRFERGAKRRAPGRREGSGGQATP
jgi:hypothetical protein